MDLTQEYILNSLRELRPKLLEKYGIEIFGIVGSWARNTATHDSDIDVVYLIKNKEKFFSIPWSIGVVWNEFQNIFEHNVDIIDWDKTKPRHKKIMQKDLVKINA